MKSDIQDKNSRHLLAWRAMGLALLALSSGFSIASGKAIVRVGDDPEQTRTIVVIGASYAKEWEIASIGGLKVVNKGVGGEQTHEMLKRFDGDVVSAKPAAVLIWGFINDVFRSPREDMSQAHVRIRQNLESMVARANAAGIKPVLATEVLITSPNRMWDSLRGWYGRIRGKQSYQAYVNQNVREVNQWIRKFGQAKNIEVLDFENVLVGKDGERNRRYATEDGSHLSKEAYAALTAYSSARLR